MRANATALANYFIDLAKKDKIDLFQFGLMKRVYIAHGFHLAYYGTSALDERFDVVEAWKNGPVIPSIYHSFKYNGSRPIIDKSVFVCIENGNIKVETPALSDKEKDIKFIAEFVWERYTGMSDAQMIELTHKKGTPWDWCYIEGKNNPIPDILTKEYYKKLIV